MPSEFDELTEADLAQLSDEERAIVEAARAEGDDEGDDARQAGGDQEEASAGAAEDQEVGGQGDAGDDGDTDGEPGTDPNPEKDEEPQQQAEAPPPAPVQLLTPVDADEEIARLNTERQEALKRAMQGDLDPDEYAKVDAQTMAKILEITQKKAADLTMQQITMQQMQVEFDRQRTDTLAQLKALGLDTSDAVQAEFTRLTAMFSNEAAERGVNDMPGNLANANYALKEAAALMQVRHNLTPAKPAAAPAAKPVKREFDRSTIPPTLANVPAAAVPQVSGEFDHLNALANAGDYTSLERAVARLTPEQQQRWVDQ